MKRFFPLLALLLLLFATVSGTVWLVREYDKKDSDRQYDLRRSYIRELQKQVALFLLAGDLDKAERLTRRVVQALPARNKPVIMLGKISFLRGDYAQAERIFRRLLLTDPDDPVIRNNLGETLIRQGLYKSGIRELTAAEAASGGAKYIQYNLCRAHLLNRNYAAAERYYQLAYRQSEDPYISLLPLEALTSMPELNVQTKGAEWVKSK